MDYRRQTWHLPLELSTQELSQLWNLAEVTFLSPNPGDDILYSGSGNFSASLSCELSSVPSNSGKSTSSLPPMWSIISEKRSKLNPSSSESPSWSLQSLKSTLSQLSFALSFVNLEHDWPDSPFHKQQKIDLFVLLRLESFGSIEWKRSISFKCLKSSLPPRQLKVSLDISKFALTSLLSSTQNSMNT